VLLYALGQPEAALDDFSAAISLDPAQPPLYFNRGLIYADLGDIEAATTDLERFIATSRNEAWVEIAQSRLTELGTTSDLRSLTP
jgi:regulator of sirC expression with transglutaminase-like and TPR domain